MSVDKQFVDSRQFYLSLRPLLTITEPTLHFTDCQLKSEGQGEEGIFSEMVKVGQLDDVVHLDTDSKWIIRIMSCTNK